MQIVLKLYCCTVLFFSVVKNHAQQIDTEFSRNGLLVFKELKMGTSTIVDFELSEEGKIHVLYECDGAKHLVRYHKKGSKDILFNVTERDLNNQNTVPVGIRSKSDGRILVLSNFWNGKRWMISISEFFENGTINTAFGEKGVFKENVWNGLDDNYGQYIYASSKDEIIVIAQIDQSNLSEKNSKIGVLKISELGKPISSNLYDDHFFTLNCSTMENDYLLLAYSESVGDGVEKATYLAGMDSDEMITSNLNCQIIEEDYQAFDKIVLLDNELYASQIGSDIEGLYYVNKYDVNGNLDLSFADDGKMSFSTDVYHADFVVNKKGEVFVISTSLHHDYEILIKKLLPNGKTDLDFGEKGTASIFLKYPIIDLNKIKLTTKDELFISGSMRVEGDSYGFITKLNLNIQQVKKRAQIEHFINNLFVQD